MIFVPVAQACQVEVVVDQFMLDDARQIIEVFFLKKEWIEFQVVVR